MSDAPLTNHAVSPVADQRRRQLRQFQFKLTAVLAGRYALRGSAAWCLAWGTAVLITRVAADPPAHWLLAGAIGLVAVALGSIILALRHTPSLDRLRAVLDGHSHCGGLLMAESEFTPGDWAQRVPTLNLPVVRWRSGRTSGLATAAGLYVLASFLVPTDLAARAAAPPLDISAQAQTLREQMQVLEEENILASEEKASLNEKLDQVQADASGHDPVKTWEALDHLDQRLDHAAAKAAESALRKTEQSAAAQELAEALSQNQASQNLSSESMSAAMSQLAQMVDQAMAETDQLDQGLSEALADALAEGKPLTSEQLAQLASAMKTAKGDLQKQIERLAQARLIDAKTLAACKAAGQCDSAGLAKFLAECEGGGGNCKEALSLWQIKRAGRGGVNRGRGDAPLTWQMRPSNKENVTFQSEALPPAAAQSLKQSQMVGVSVGAPTEDAQAPAATGALSGAQSGGGSAARQTVLPRHRATVQRYFDRRQEAPQ